MSLDRGSQLGRGLPPASPEPLLRLLQEPGRGATTSFEPSTCVFRGFQVGELCLACPLELDHVGESRAVLAPEVREKLQASPDCLETVGILLEPLVPQPQLSGHVLDVGLGSSERHSKVGEGFVSRQPGYRYPEQVGSAQAWMGLRSVGSRQSVASFGDRSPERPDLREQRLLGGELFVLVDSGDRRRGNLVLLEAEKTDCARQHPGIATELRKACSDGGELHSCLRDLLEVGSGISVERLSLCCLVQQGLMHVLAVQVDEAVADLGQR